MSFLLIIELVCTLCFATIVDKTMPDNKNTPKPQPEGV